MLGEYLRTVWEVAKIGASNVFIGPLSESKVGWDVKEWIIFNKVWDSSNEMGRLNKCFLHILNDTQYFISSN